MCPEAVESAHLPFQGNSMEEDAFGGSGFFRNSREALSVALSVAGKTTSSGISEPRWMKICEGNKRQRTKRNFGFILLPHHRLCRYCSMKHRTFGACICARPGADTVSEHGCGNVILP